MARWFVKAACVICLAAQIARPGPETATSALSKQCRDFTEFSRRGTRSRATDHGASPDVPDSQTASWFQAFPFSSIRRRGSSNTFHVVFTHPNSLSSAPPNCPWTNSFSFLESFSPYLPLPFSPLPCFVRLFLFFVSTISLLLSIGSTPLLISARVSARQDLRRRR